MKIVLIDDDSEDAELFCEALREVDPRIQCLGFKIPQQAIDHLHAEIEKPAYIFMDAHLPSASSAQLLGQIKKMEGLNGAKIFIYSGYVSEEEISEYRRIGADDVIIKPSYYDDLRKTLARLLRPKD